MNKETLYGIGQMISLVLGVVVMIEESIPFGLAIWYGLGVLVDIRKELQE